MAEKNPENCNLIWNQIGLVIRIRQLLKSCPVDNFGTVVGENPTPYGILVLWAVNGLSIVYWVRIKSRSNVLQKVPKCLRSRQFWDCGK